MTPSLTNFFWSLGWGGLVVGIIVAGLLFVSQADKIKRS
ncbi:photosystem II reaction center X protein [Lusitaniella coriacea LEGE 07157]|uniref:Photosystem II reaction center protein X n=1 Tax=Lusitaniella coriacea LEGE 07157 TaxID=945747 RepID=A0A8J7DLF4_9CYAN|nr:photosystem II reaction center X protein [Lusitaniella coriacea]MBE9114953.1 photosystem II reaction center X protein [Lusitaniella coriacea LEGE 07157]